MAVPMLRININQIAIPDGNNNPRMRSSSRKCLFGSADPAETARLVEENFRKEKQRFFERFGVEMHELETIAAENAKKSPTKRRSCPEKQVTKMTSERIARQMRALKPYNGQPKITDFCQIKKKSSTILQQNKKL